jgi:mycothiol synthase
MVHDPSVPSEEMRCENVTEAGIASYAEQGYTLTFVEEVMRYDLSRALPSVAVPVLVTYLSWAPERTHDFFTVYTASFRERPGFPGWSETEWVRWTSGDPMFRPDLSSLAVVQGQAAGFVTNAEDEEAPAQHGYIVQVGVHPDFRGQRLGAALTTHSLHAWRETGKEAVMLHVNSNNPGAIRLYQQLGFVVVRRRGTFARRAV